MRVLIYEPLPDMNRGPIVAQLAKTLLADGHDVLVVIEEKLIYTLLGKLSSQRVINCTLTWREHIGRHEKLSIYKLRTPPFIYTLVNRSNYQTRLKKIASLRTEQYDRLLKAFNPEKIFIWNGQHEHLQDFMEIAKRNNGHDFIYMECGWFPQKGTIYFDKKGVNAASSIAHEKNLEICGQQLQELETWRMQFLDNPDTKAPPQSRQNFIFLPLQVETDTNITLYSPFKSMQGFLDYVSRWIPEEFSLVVRPHPLSETDISAQSNPRFLIDTQSPASELISASSMVIGINSTMLLESLMYKKQVIAFGDGFLEKTGIGTPFQQATINTFDTRAGLLYRMALHHQDQTSSCANAAALLREPTGTTNPNQSERASAFRNTRNHQFLTPLIQAARAVSARKFN